MYFHRKKSATGNEVLQLLASYRPKGASPRHCVVVSLGEAELPDAWLSPLAKVVERRLKGELALPATDLPPEALEWVDRIVAKVEREGNWPPPLLPRKAGDADPAAPAASRRHDVVEDVLADKVSHSHNTPLGPLLPGLDAWERLGMPRLLNRLGFSSAQSQAACALALGRLADPLSEHAFVHWLPFGSLPDLLGEEVLRGGTDRYYRVGDKLLENRDAIERHLREALAGELGLTRTLILYDLTNFHFEGICAGNDKARRGKNKQGRDDCPQVVVGMAFDEHGFELLHRTWPGNRNDAKTLPEIVKEMAAATRREGDLDFAPPTVVLDGGLGTAANLRELRGMGLHYIVHDRRTQRKEWLDEFLKEELFHPVAGRQEGEQVLVRHVDLKATGDTPCPERIVLCRSDGRREKESAIRSKAEERLLDDFAKLEKALAAGRPKDAAAAQRRLGRILGRHPRAARFYQADIAERNGRLWLEWKRKGEKVDDDELLGCYVLRTDRPDLGDEELWRLYTTLSRAEAGFRMVKSDLGIRPAFHQTEDRVDAHVFITVLAYQLLRFCLHRLESKGDRRSWPTIRRVLSTHCYATIHLPTRNGSIVRLRRPGEPEAMQEEIYAKLGITLGELPRTKNVIQKP